MDISDYYTGNAPFPVESTMKILGDRGTVAGIGALKPTFPQRDLNLSLQRYKRLEKEYLRKIASDITFSKDVIQDRGLPSLAYVDCDMRRLYDTPDIIMMTRKHRGHPVGREDPPAQLPCQLRSAILKSRKLRKVEGVLQKCDKELQKRSVEISCSNPTMASPHVSASSVDALVLGSFITEPVTVPSVQPKTDNIGVPTVGPVSPQSLAPKSDEFLIKNLSMRTAQWIVSQQIAPGPTKTRLQALLRERYGPISDMNLVEDEPMTDNDFRRYKESKLLPKDSQPGDVQQERPETPLPVYYRVPGFYPTGAREDEPGSINRTAMAVTVKHLEPPPPKLQDLLNPRAGKHVYATDSFFEQELYSGASAIVYQQGEKAKDRIVMANLNEYQKHLQQPFPRPLKTWGLKEQDKHKIHKSSWKPDRGARRWVTLPSPADYAAERGLRAPDYMMAQKQVEQTRKEYRPREELQALRHMVDEWRKAWRLTTRWQDVTVEKLKKDLGDLHYNVRVSAMAACASGAVSHPAIEPDCAKLGAETTAAERLKPVLDVPEELQPMITAALDDQNDRVRMAAAICHYAMRAGNQKARDIMWDSLLHGYDADSWAAAQSLALTGDASYPVINRILTQLFETEEKKTVEQACLLLAQLSEVTTLAHSLLAERLNSGNWRDKILACRSISCLRGPVSKDLTNKLTYLMWNDWNAFVRQAAAQALGKMGMGKVVHNVLREKLENGNPKMKVEALSLIGELKIMTGKLLPGFLQCFSDDFASVRKEACLVAAALKIKDDMVLNQLMRLMQNDPIWKIKAFATKALGEIGHVTPHLKELLLWSLHYEDQPGIRIEACNSIVMLNLRDPETEEVLHDRLIVDPHPLVREEVVRALRVLGLASSGHQEMLQRIRHQVDQLCQKDIVTQKLLILENMEHKMSQHALRIDLRKQPHGMELFEDPVLLLERAFSGQSRPSTLMTSAPLTPESELHGNAEIQFILDNASSSSTPWTQETSVSVMSQNKRRKSHEQRRSIMRGSVNSARSYDRNDDTDDYW